MICPGYDVKLHPVTKAQFSTIEVCIGSNADDSMGVLDCPLPSRRKCLCKMPQDAGHAFCRCAMTEPMSLFYIFGRNINDSHYYYNCEHLGATIYIQE